MSHSVWPAGFYELASSVTRVTVVQISGRELSEVSQEYYLFFSVLYASSYTGTFLFKAK